MALIAKRTRHEVLPPLDWPAMRAEVGDLRTIVARDLNDTGRRDQWCCPFHPDTTPSLSVNERSFYCHGCSAKGDVFDWVGRRGSMTNVEAARHLGLIPEPGDEKPKKKPLPPPPPRPVKTYAWQTAEWQSAAEELVARAESDLWSPAGRDALAWLKARGLAGDVIRRFRLGFFAAPGGHRGIEHVRGITLPWVHPTGWHSTFDGDPEFRWVGVNVRRLNADVWEPWQGPDKCRCFKGSERGYPYPIAGAAPGVEAIITEGEFDGLLAYQHLGHLLNPINIGGAGMRDVKPASRADLAVCPSWLVATDHDRAGDEAARWFADLAPHKAHRAYLPEGKDFTDFVVGGGDPLEWAKSEARRLHWRSHD